MIISHNLIFIMTTELNIAYFGQIALPTAIIKINTCIIEVTHKFSHKINDSYFARRD